MSVYVAIFNKSNDNEIALWQNKCHPLHRAIVGFASPRLPFNITYKWLSNDLALPSERETERRGDYTQKLFCRLLTKSSFGHAWERHLLWLRWTKWLRVISGAQTMIYVRYFFIYFVQSLVPAAIVMSAGWRGRFASNCLQEREKTAHLVGMYYRWHR